MEATAAKVMNGAFRVTAPATTAAPAASKPRARRKVKARPVKDKRTPREALVDLITYVATVYDVVDAIDRDGHRRMKLPAHTRNVFGDMAQAAAEIIGDLGHLFGRLK